VAFVIRMLAGDLLRFREWESAAPEPAPPPADAP